MIGPTWRLRVEDPHPLSRAPAKDSRALRSVTGWRRLGSCHAVMADLKTKVPRKRARAAAGVDTTLLVDTGRDGAAAPTKSKRAYSLNALPLDVPPEGISGGTAAPPEMCADLR